MVGQHTLRACKSKPRVFILSDISNEPDDAQSLVRYLLYSNEFDTRGLVACTSTFLRSHTSPEDMVQIVNAYGLVVENLNIHVHPLNQYPSSGDLLKLIKSGPKVYGKDALDPGVPLSEGAALLIEQLDASNEPLWVLVWGGVNTLAQALHYLQQNRGAAECALVRAKLRVYAISDQDDTGLWIRTNYPDIFYICSLHGWNQYGLATWFGISGDAVVNSDPGGSDPTKVSKEWMNANIQIGPLGQKYPEPDFIYEGDTPTFLYLIQNGLGSSEHPEYGSWGGRYSALDFPQTGRHYADAVDHVEGVDGRRRSSNQATIWRWRDAYQNDFAGRIQWTLTNERSKANHAPVAIVNHSTSGPEALELEVEVGKTIVLDASKSYDPDGDELTFDWFQYKEATAATHGLIDILIPDIDIQNLDSDKPGRRVQIQIPPAEKCAIEFTSGVPQERGQTFHFVLQLKDNGTPTLTTYKRVVVRTTNRKLRGGRGSSVARTMDYLALAGLK